MRPHRITPSAVLVLVCACSAPPPDTPARSPGGASGALQSSAGSADATRCPGKGFNGFFRAFATDSGVRARYTADPVRVTDWVDAGDENPVSAETLVRRVDYDGFTLSHANGVFRHLDANGEPWGEPVTPRFEASGSGVLVRYAIGHSEGNSWLFARRGGCWELVADPEPSVE